MNQNITDKISDMKIVPLKESNYLKPLRAEFQINGKQKYWDFLTIHDSVSILIFNTSRKVLVFVRQFRPSMYLGLIPNVQAGATIDTKKYDLSKGYSLELCAGLVDREGRIEEIAKDEVLEECGYDVSESSLRKLFSFRSVSITGQTQTVYYVEVTDSQKVSCGGGLKEEGEFIEVVELTVKETKEYINSKDLLSPPAFLAAVQWFLQNVMRVLEEEDFMKRIRNGEDMAAALARRDEEIQPKEQYKQILLSSTCCQYTDCPMSGIDTDRVPFVQFTHL